MVGRVLLASALALQVSLLQLPPRCIEALNDDLSGAAAEVCLGEQEAHLAAQASIGSADRARRLQAAVQHYKRAGNLTERTATKIRVLDALAQVYDPQHLDDPAQMEAALRELIALQPNDFDPQFRLAKLQEDRGLLDAAEDTLLGARRQQPDAAEPYRMLAQFYARRATAMRQGQKPAPPQAAGPGEPDQNGVYNIGGSVAPPRREGNPVYPVQAMAAGINGAVVAEIVVSESGQVTDAKIVRSIPLLDEAALEAVRKWRYEPTIVNGKSVPVRMSVTVNFSLK